MASNANASQSSSSGSSDEELADITRWSTPSDQSSHFLTANRRHHRVVDSGEEEQQEAAAGGEDTDDASENGDAQTEESYDIKEQMYMVKVDILQKDLEELIKGNHPEFKKRMKKFEMAFKERQVLNEAWKNHELVCIEKNDQNERKLAGKEFETKKNELKDALILQFEAEKKQIELSKTMELVVDTTEEKPVSTRKLRRRAHDPVPASDKRGRRLPQSHITFLLGEKEVEDDLRSIMKSKTLPPTLKKKPQQQPASTTTTVSQPKSSENGLSISPEIRVEDGKLFYEKRWFHRGQPVFLEGEESDRIIGIILGISADVICIRRVSDQSKYNVLLANLVNGKCSIKQRA